MKIKELLIIGDKKMNKKGDLPTVVLVIGVFVVCSLALASFYVSNFKVKNSFVGVEVIEELTSQIEENLFRGESIDNLYLDKNKTKITPNFGFNWREEVIVFSVTYNP